MKTTTPRIAVPLIAALAALAACTSSGGNDAKPAQGDTFAPAPASVTCQEHQKDNPGTAYTSEEEGDTGKVLQMLEHYTANGRKPYCDGKPPTPVDLAWAKLYTQFGADPGYLSPDLGGSGTPDDDPTPAP